jgi:hypothetical protein
MADGDRLIAPKPALRIAGSAPKGELRRYPFSHFGMYFGPGFDRAVADQVAFLRRHLLPDREEGAPAELPPAVLEALP